MRLPSPYDKLLVPVYVPSLLMAVSQEALTILLPLYVLSLGESAAFAAWIAFLRGVGILLFAVPAGVLLATGNQVEVTAHVGAGAPYSIVYVNGFTLGYARAFQAVGDQLSFQLGTPGRVVVHGFSSPTIYLVDLAQFQRIPLQVGATNGGTDGSDFVRYGVLHVGLSWPGRYSHSPVEVLDLGPRRLVGRVDPGADMAGDGLFPGRRAGASWCSDVSRQPRRP